MCVDEREALLCSKYGKINTILNAYDIAKEDKEDLLHEIFIAALRSLHQLRDIDKMDSWLWKIANNKLKQYFRKHAKDRYKQVLMDEAGLDLSAMNADSLVDDEVARAFESSEAAKDLWEALNQLDKKTEIVMKLYYVSEYKLIEIAQITNQNYNTVKSLHSRGIVKLRAFLNKRREDY